MSRLVIMRAEKHEGLLGLRQAWIEGGNDDTTFDLTCGAGTGSAIICLVVNHKGERRTEVIDIQDALVEWVNAIVTDIQANA